MLVVCRRLESEILRYRCYLMMWESEIGNSLCCDNGKLSSKYLVGYLFDWDFRHTRLHVTDWLLIVTTGLSIHSDWRMGSLQHDDMAAYRYAEDTFIAGLNFVFLFFCLNIDIPENNPSLMSSE
jgi:hypothetical protein